MFTELNQIEDEGVWDILQQKWGLKGGSSGWIFFITAESFCWKKKGRGVTGLYPVCVPLEEGRGIYSAEGRGAETYDVPEGVNGVIRRGLAKLI